MGFNEFLSKIFGNKSQRDLKEIMPFIDRIKAVEPRIQALDNDGLRALSADIKKQIAEYVATERKKVTDLRQK